MTEATLLKSLSQQGLVIPHSALLGGRLSFERPVFCGAVLRNINRIGAFTYALGTGKSEIWNSTIGRYCSIAPGVTMGAPGHPTDYLSTHPFAFLPNSFMRMFDEFRAIATTHAYESSARDGVVVGNDVWIGQNAVIMRGVTIGHGAIIGAGAVVTHDVEAYTIVAGVPARPIRKRFDSGTIERLQAINWWDYDLSSLKGRIDYANASASLDVLENAVRSERLQRLEPVMNQVSIINGELSIESGGGRC